MADASQNFSKLVPGFDFLQGLVKNAGQALPSIGQWVAPTLNPEELEKRIEELRTVQFWLEQNARMLAATIQALEVQRMTLSTLKTMNVPLTALRDSLKVAEPDAPPPPAPAAAAAAKKPPARISRKKSPAETATPAVDPMQWWGALTKQFTQLATTAMRDSAGDAAKTLAGNMVKQSFDAAEETLKKAVQAPGKVAGAMAKAAVKGARSASASATSARKRGATRR
jgi:prefoldin subunit 5